MMRNSSLAANDDPPAGVTHDGAANRFETCIPRRFLADFEYQPTAGDSLVDHGLTDKPTDREHAAENPQ